MNLSKSSSKFSWKTNLIIPINHKNSINNLNLSFQQSKHFISPIQTSHAFYSKYSIFNPIPLTKEINLNSQKIQFFAKFILLNRYYSQGKKVSDKYGYDPLYDKRDTRKKQPQKIKIPNYLSAEELFQPSENLELYQVLPKPYIERKELELKNRRNDLQEEEFQLLKHKVALKEINTLTRDVVLMDQMQGNLIGNEFTEEDVLVDAYDEKIERKLNEPFMKDRYHYIIEELQKELFDIQQVMKGYISNQSSEKGSIQKLDYDSIGLKFKAKYLQEIQQWGSSLSLDFEVEYLIRCFASSDFIIKNAKNHEALLSNQFLYMNRQMETLGEKILSLCIELFLEHHYTDIIQGDLTKLRHLMISEKILSETAEALGMKRFYLNPEFEDEGSMVLRSLIGTIFMKLGYESALRIIWEHILPKIIVKSQEKKLSVYYIEHLEQMVKYFGHTIPHYKRHNIPNDQGTYIVGVYINDRLVAEGYGKSVHDAQLDAAVSCYSELMKDKSDAYFLPNYQNKNQAAQDSKKILEKRREQLVLLEEARKSIFLSPNPDTEIHGNLDANV